MISMATTWVIYVSNDDKRGDELREQLSSWQSTPLEDGTCFIKEHHLTIDDEEIDVA